MHLRLQQRIKNRLKIRRVDNRGGSSTGRLRKTVGVSCPRPCKKVRPKRRAVHFYCILRNVVSGLGKTYLTAISQRHFYCLLEIDRNGILRRKSGNTEQRRTK